MNWSHKGKDRSALIAYICALTMSMLGLQACMEVQSGVTRGALPPIAFVAIHAIYDSVPISPATKYFYRYQSGSRDDDKSVTVDWRFANLSYSGVNPIEAWYYAGSSTTHFGNGAEGMTIVPPLFIVGLAKDDADMIRLHFQAMESFDPGLQPNGPGSRLTHYVRKSVKDDVHPK